ncbi:hypothetical protein ACSLBF_06050 [Pseudoalteromonas sp. T1lg65]|uniref:hypothetical protein n=1 Tax=Pseudoalteromonas sp. T1lg65 TaxID=2077101 RepID=UPI003F7A2C16
MLIQKEFPPSAKLSEGLEGTNVVAFGAYIDDDQALAVEPSWPRTMIAGMPLNVLKNTLQGGYFDVTELPQCLYDALDTHFPKVVWNYDGKVHSATGSVTPSFVGVPLIGENIDSDSRYRCKHIYYDWKDTALFAFYGSCLK